MALDPADPERERGSLRWSRALGRAYDAVTDWIRGRGFELVGPMRERYLNGPDENVSPAEYQTEVEIPVVAVAAPVTG